MQNNIDASKQVQDLTKAYSNLTKEVSHAVDVFKEYQKTNQKLPSDYLNSLKQLKDVQDQYNKAIANANGNLKQYVANKKEEQRLNKQMLSLKAKLNQATSQESKEAAKLRVEIAEVNKQNKQQAQLSSKLVSEYTKQGVILSQLRTKYKDVALKKGETSKEAKNLLGQITRLDSKLKKVDASVGQFGRNVGNYPKLLGGATASLRSFAAAFGFTSAVFILAQTVRNAIKVFKEFDQSQADLAAILGRNTSEITALTEQAKELGATTAFTATQVAELQLELAKLGFTDNQILDATLGIENLAIATGVDAARAAKLGGAALRGFALDASEANRVAATLAVSTTKSASTFESLEVALPKVSAIAKSFGFTIEDTTALLGGLQNAGFEASIAGTSLRQIFLQLADSNGKLAKRLGGGAKNFDELIEQFKKAEAEGISLSEAFNLTNARSVAAFKTFLSGADDLKVLRDSIVDVEDELDELAEQKLDSVQGRITLLNSAWEGWILSLDKSGSAANSIKNTLEFLTKNLDRILNTVVKVGKAFLIYKTILIATSLATRVYSGAIVALRLSKIALAGGIGKATIAMRAFNIASKSNPIGALISVIAGGISILVAFKDGVNETAKALKLMQDNADKATEAIVKNTISQVEAQLAQIDIETSNAEKANRKKLELLNENIKAQEEGTANLYSTQADLDEADKEREKQGYVDRLNNFNNFIKDRQKAQQNLSPEDLENARIASPEELYEKGGYAEFDEFLLDKRTDAEKQIIDKLKALRKNLIKSLQKANEDASKGKSKREKLKTLLELYGLPTTEEAQKQLEKYGKGMLKVLRDNFNLEENLLPKEIELPEIIPPLSAEKLKFYKENFVFSDQEMELIGSQFDALGEMYGVDASKFTALFDQKQNTVDDYVAAAGEAMKGLYNSFANDYTDDLERLRANADNALLFAKDSSSAQEEIRTQLAEKERQIRIKQAKEEKNQALFNIFVNTATAVTQALPNIPLSVIVGSIGLAQLAAVQSRGLPAFYEGTEDTGKGGKVDSKGGFNAVLHPNERVMTSEQNKKMHGYSNDKVSNIINEFHNKTLFDTELQNMLNFNGIFNHSSHVPNVKIESNSLSRQDYLQGVNDLKKTIMSSPTLEIVRDERGYNVFQKKGQARTKSLNNVQHVKSRIV